MRVPAEPTVFESIARKVFISAICTETESEAVSALAVRLFEPELVVKSLDVPPLPLTSPDQLISLVISVIVPSSSFSAEALPV